jgi:hypothetical protein
MTNLVFFSVKKNNFSKNKKAQDLYYSIFDFMGFILLYKYTKPLEQECDYTNIPLAKQLFDTTKEIIKAIFSIILFVFCYIYMSTYTFCECDNELITTCSTNFVELQPISTRNIGYMLIFEDFFSKFTSKAKTINYIIEIKPYIKTLIPIEHNLGIVEKPIILNKIKSYHINSIISECNFYKNKTSLLEIQLQETKITYFNLVNDLNNILKDVDKWRIK